MRRRRLLGALPVILTGCISVNSDVQSGDGGDGGDGARSTGTTVEAGGGGGSPIGENDLPIVRQAIIRAVNQERQQIDGTSPLSNDGSRAQTLHDFAESHTEVMHSTGRVSVDLEASDLVDQLEEANCSIPRPDNPFNYNDEETAFVDDVETTGRTPDELATVLVNRWLDRARPRGLIHSTGAKDIALGLALRGTTLLVTVIFC